jgi:hypothetical protein
MIWAVIWYWIFLVFTAADIITTKIALSIGKPYYESNLLISPIIEHMVELKILVVVVVVSLAILYEKLYKGDGWVPLAMGSCFTFKIVLSNILILAL